MSARTAVELADRRRDLVEHDVRAGTIRHRAATYLHVCQQAPAAVLAWSWVLSAARDGIGPGVVRAVLADAASRADDRACSCTAAKPDPALAQQMARYWLACIRAGDDPEVAAAKLLRVFDLVPRYRPDPTEDR